MMFYLRCRRLQSGAAAQADSGGLLMDKLPRFAKVFAGRRRIVEMDISLRLRNLAEFFNSLLGTVCGLGGGLCRNCAVSVFPGPSRFFCRRHYSSSAPVREKVAW